MFDYIIILGVIMKYVNIFFVCFVISVHELTVLASVAHSTVLLKMGETVCFSILCMYKIDIYNKWPIPINVV